MYANAFTASLLLSPARWPAESCAACSGRLRIVAPVALLTALAIAADVDTVGGSPMPITPRARSGSF